MNTQQYVGRIASVPGNDGFAFIGLTSVSKNDGSPHELPTIADIFLHREDCGSDLRVGMIVAFDVVPDLKRGDGNYRAMGAVEFVEAELLPPNEAPMPGFTGTLAPFESAPREVNLTVSPTLAQRNMKAVPVELVEQVLRNQPVATVSRDSSVPPNAEELMRVFLRFLFPNMEQFGTAFSLEGTEEELEKKVAEAVQDQVALGMHDQVKVMKAEVARFESARGALGFLERECLVRKDTIIPIRYLPDFFMAVPVWYFWTDGESTREAEMSWNSADALVHSSTKYFCNLFPNQNWADVYQMFNRRLRTLTHYKGDLIPPHVSRRIREATQLFDYVVIMTPYLDVAGKDWSDTQWVRSIDPYVVGFKKGIPYFFILARFSDSGTFPLFNELLADTIGFLKKKAEGLRGFNLVNGPYWHVQQGSVNYALNAQGTYFNGYNLGDHLIRVVAELLAKFKEEKLFDWLRGEEVNPPVPTAQQ